MAGRPKKRNEIAVEACAATLRDGSRCRSRNTVPGSAYCFGHHTLELEKQIDALVVRMADDEPVTVTRTLELPATDRPLGLWSLEEKLALVEWLDDTHPDLVLEDEPSFLEAA